MTRRGAARRGRGRHRSPVLLVLVATTALVVALPALLGGDPIAQDLSRSLEPPSSGHLLGTDQYGRDVLLRLVHGARRSYLSALAVVSLALLVGGAIGIAAATAPRVLRMALDRLIDVALGLPGVVLALAVVGVLGSGQRNLVIAMAVGVWPWYARLAREHAATLATLPFVDAARIAGIGQLRILRGHIAPHLLRRLTIVGALDVGYTIIAFAGLSYLGLGIEQPAPDLGTMLRDGQDVFLDAGWLLVAPSAAIAAIVLPFVVAGERGHAGGIA